MRSIFIAAFHVLCLALVCLSHGAHSAPSTSPVNVVFDTDMWGDIDDAMALAMLHALHDRREVNLIAVSVNTDDKWCASYVDLVNTFYGHPDIPLGLERNGLTVDFFLKKLAPSKPTTYTRTITQKTNADGSLLYPRRLADATTAPSAVTVLRQSLAAQPDNSVVVIAVGYSTNLARLLDSTADSSSPLTGRELVKKKVRWLSVMAGSFADVKSDGETFVKGSPEWNLMLDIPSAQKVFSQWPTPLVASGFELGLALRYPGRTIEREYSYAENHPIADTYYTFCAEEKAKKSVTRCPHDHATFDLTSVLYAARPDGEYFSLSKPGKITVLADGGSRFEEVAGGAHRHLIVTEAQKARALEAMVMLTSQPPSHRASHSASR